LSTVGRTIRDRIELRRRVRAQATQAQASVVGILFIIYGIGFITWRTSPERTIDFVNSEIGMNLISASMILQAVGLMWMFRLSRFKF
jgi:tight adherence protein B